jgi:poly(A) polymerase
MNTLLTDSEGRVYDPLGQGLEHLAARRVVFVGEAAARIDEDYLRILRFFRFHAAYGSGDPDAYALAACKAAADKIAGLSRERITQEIFKILVVDNPVGIFELMFSSNVLKDFYVSKHHNDFFRHFCTFQARYGLISLNSRLYVMLGMEQVCIKTAEKFLLFPKVFQRDFQAISDCLAGDDLAQDLAVRAAVYRFGRTITAQVLMIELAQDRVMNGYAPKALEIIQTWDIPDFPLSGDDLLKAGMKPGPELGAALEAIENFWIAQDFKPDRTACLARVKDF